MGSLFRSELMEKCNLYLETDCAYKCIAEMGELGCLQFNDLNPKTNATLRKYVGEIRRCEEIERTIRYVLDEAKAEKIEIPSDEFMNPPTPPLSALSNIEIQMGLKEERLRQSKVNISTLKENFSSLVEVSHVVRNAKTVFLNANYQTDDNAPRDSSNLTFTAATVLQDKVPALERLLFFACRNNVLVKTTPIDDQLEDPTTKFPILKSVVFVFFQGDQLKAKVRKILEGFRATIYPCPDNAQESEQLLTGITQKIEDMTTVLEQSSAFRSVQLRESIDELPDWLIQVKKVKAVFHILNGFDLDTAHKYMVGECWCPVVHFEEVRTGLLTATESSNSPPSAAIFSVIDSQGMTPPTYHRTNKFTRVFQGVVNAYGIATYQEVNPAPFIIITFPFLFSVMFGDAGHGVILFLAALALVVFEKRLGGRSNNEIWNIFFGGRYIVLLMGILSIYSGMIYNDIFAKPFNIFGSAWSANPYKYHEALRHEKTFMLNPLTIDNISDYRGHPYSFGMDPIWQMASNKITWTNSFKMKVSISFGVCQMFFGVVLSAFNHKHFKSALNVLCEFLPEMLFLMCMFGYLVILIFYKWIAFDATKSSCSPSLLINLINMFLITYTGEPCAPPPLGCATVFSNRMFLANKFRSKGLRLKTLTPFRKKYIFKPEIMKLIDNYSRYCKSEIFVFVLTIFFIHSRI